MKFLVPNYRCLQNPWLRGYHPQIPVLSVLNWICWNPPPSKKIPGYATGAYVNMWRGTSTSVHGVELRCSSSVTSTPGQYRGCPLGSVWPKRDCDHYICRGLPLVSRYCPGWLSVCLQACTKLASLGFHSILFANMFHNKMRPCMLHEIHYVNYKLADVGRWTGLLEFLLLLGIDIQGVRWILRCSWFVTYLLPAVRARSC